LEYNATLISFVVAMLTLSDQSLRAPYQFVYVTTLFFLFVLVCKSYLAIEHLKIFPATTYCVSNQG